MPLRTDREVEPLPTGDVEVLRNRRGVEVEVGVDESDPLTVRGEGAGFHRISLAKVPVVVDDANACAGTRSEQALAGVVDRPVGHDDHLDVLTGEPLSQ